MQTEQTPSPRPATTRVDAEHAVRRWAVASLAGALAGLAIGGVGGRLFMGVLAGMNREDHGTITSDGFPMGEVTVLGTLNLLLVGTLIGVLGGGLYLVLRDLRTGPPWFDRACIAVGATVVVGAVMVHSDGPDFTRLGPTWAALAMTLAVPFTYAVLLPVVAERWSREDSPLMTGRSRWPYVALLPWVFPLIFLTPLLVLGWFVRRSLTRSTRPIARLTCQVMPWVGRLALTALFIFALVNLVTTIGEIHQVIEGFPVS